MDQLNIEPEDTQDILNNLEEATNLNLPQQNNLEIVIIERGREMYPSSQESLSEFLNFDNINIKSTAMDSSSLNNIQPASPYNFDEDMEQRQDLFEDFTRSDVLKHDVFFPTGNPTGSSHVFDSQEQYYQQSINLNQDENEMEMETVDPNEIQNIIVVGASEETKIINVDQLSNAKDVTVVSVEPAPLKTPEIFDFILDFEVSIFKEF